MRRFPSETVAAQVLAVLDSWGMPGRSARTTTEVMVDADLAGIDSHGISMLPAYQSLVRSGRLDVAAVPKLVRESGTTALLDAQDGLGHAAMHHATDLAIDKAAEHGLGAVAVRRSHHFGAAGFYAQQAARAGKLGLVGTTTRTAAVVPTRGVAPLLGTNPIAFAAPTADGDRPFVLDMSTSSVAVNKVKVHEFLGRDLPSGWVVDGRGSAVTDPAVAYAGLRAEETGGLTPLGGTEEMSSHKGYGLAVMVQILAGALAGAAFGPARDRGGPDDIGHFCLVIDPSAFGPAEVFRQTVDDIVSTLHAQPVADPDRPVLVAGDPERSCRADRTRRGIPLSGALLARLREVCAETGAADLLGEE